MRSTLKRPWIAGFVATILFIALFVARTSGDQSGDDSETLPPLSPTPVELASSAGAVIVLFLVLWAVFALTTWLLRRRMGAED